MLKEKYGERTLPIWIGDNEAMAIAMFLEGYKPPRPLTHDLIKILLDALESKIIKVVINDLKNETYYARIYIETDGKLISVDARPSDSIALALRANATIFVEDDIMAKNGIIFKEDETGKLKNKLRDTKPEEFGKYEIK
ncbi:MAG: bifunctional nuclease family protein [candidate division WOR-3 bacterium]|nr:bifunctional nuclease family protein [candidate division WOR-3 bacterium]